MDSFLDLLSDRSPHLPRSHCRERLASVAVPSLIRALGLSLPPRGCGRQKPSPTFVEGVGSSARPQSAAAGGAMSRQAAKPKFAPPPSVVQLNKNTNWLESPGGDGNQSMGRGEEVILDRGSPGCPPPLICVPRGTWRFYALQADPLSKRAGPERTTNITPFPFADAPGYRRHSCVTFLSLPPHRSPSPPPPLAGIWTSYVALLLALYIILATFVDSGIAWTALHVLHAAVRASPPPEFSS